ncbi:uncharacterized protein FN964_009504 [Alca torda]
MHLFQLYVPARAMQRRAASHGEQFGGCHGTGVPWLSGGCPAPAPAHLPASPVTAPGWQHPSPQHCATGRRELGLSWAPSMSGAEALGPRGLEGTEACMGDVPSLKEIEQLLSTGRPSCNHVDEVWPNLFLGDLVTAHNRFVLWKMGVTHVLNAAHGTAYSHGGQDFYGATIDYYGVPAHDLPSFDISQFFFSAAQFIHNALNTPGAAKILVHCAVGVSRSASLVLAYLMINHHLSLVEAIKTVKEHRWISPNRGFLKHLQNLDASTYSHSQRQDSGLDGPLPECVRERSTMPHTRDSSSPTSSAGSRAAYETPALSDLQRLFWFRGGSDNHVDQVWPNIYLGDAWAARSKTTLQSLNITHILNAADGPYSINTGAKYYKDLQIEYYGVEAFDDPSFDLSIFFYDAANFIGKALNTSGGKVFVHCAMGVSRSASLVLAFLMIHENMTLVDALKTVSAHRDICPNSGFLSQLRDLDIKLNEERKGTRESATKEL